MVLRPNVLSLYRDQNESKLRKKINLSEITAVASRKGPKQKRPNVFTLFSPSRNYHFQAASEKELHDWVDLIRTEARIDDDEEEMFLAHPETGPRSPVAYQGHTRLIPNLGGPRTFEDRYSTSPEPPGTRDGHGLSSNLERMVSHTVEFSGNESDFQNLSEDGGLGALGQGTSSLSLSRPSRQDTDPTKADTNATAIPPSPTRQAVEFDEERVIWHGYLLQLKSAGGVRVWKKLWVVLRPKHLAVYKNDEVHHPLPIFLFS
jgi:PH domain